MQAVDFFKPAGDSLEIEVINVADATVQSCWKDDNMSVTQTFGSQADEISFYSQYFSDVMNDSRLIPVQRKH